MGKGEIAHYKQFLLFPVFSKDMYRRNIKNKGLFGKGKSFLYTERQKNPTDFWYLWNTDDTFRLFKRTLTSINMENLLWNQMNQQFGYHSFVDVCRFAMWKWIHFTYVKKFYILCINLCVSFVFPGFLTPVLTLISFQSHQLLFSHALVEVRGENTPERNFRL